MSNQIFKLDDFPKATQFFDAALTGDYRVIIYGGAIRGGKTFTSLGTLVMLHTIYPGSRSIIVRDNLSTLKINTLPSCEKVFPTAFIENYNASSFKWNFNNGSTTFFFGESIDRDPELDRWNGLEVNFILLEQAEELQKATFEKSLERVGSYVLPRGLKQPPPIIMITVNPTQTWVKEFIYDKWKNDQLPDNWLYIPAFITDNPNIPDNYIESLKELKIANPVKYQRFVEGDWEIAEQSGAEFYKKFNYQVQVQESAEFSEARDLHISFDFNVVPYCTITIWQIDFNGDTKLLKQVDEICAENPNNSTKGACKLFKEKYRNHRAGLFIYGDPAGKAEDTRSEAGHNDFRIIEGELSQFRPHMRIAKAAPSVVKRGEFINALFGENHAGVYVLIHPDCKETIKDYMNVKEHGDGTKVKQKATNKVSKQTFEKYGHTSDANDYFFCELLINEYVEFVEGGSYGAPILGPPSTGGNYHY